MQILNYVICLQHNEAKKRAPATVASDDVDKWRREYRGTNENEKICLSTPLHPHSDQWQRWTPRLYVTRHKKKKKIYLPNWFTIILRENTDWGRAARKANAHQRWPII